MKKFILPFALFSVLTLSSCEMLIMEPEPKVDNLSIFNEYSKLCVEKYGLSDVKNVDLKALSDSIRPQITQSLTQAELFDKMKIITQRMQEGHSYLESIDGNLTCGYTWYLGYPAASNRAVDLMHYYGIDANPDVQKIAPPTSFYEVLYGYLPQNKDIGYISILSFDLDISNAELEKMMQYLKDAKGLIIDVRDNLGGYRDLMARMAGYFTSNEVVIGTNYIKNGPGKDHYAKSEMKIKPSGSIYTFTKPVVVLQNRLTFSSASLFCIAMSAFNNVTTMGQISGGGTGEIMDGFLANGWHWTISTSNLVDLQGNPSDSGLEPKVLQLINPTDTDKDAVIEQALLKLQ